MSTIELSQMPPSINHSHGQRRDGGRYLKRELIAWKSLAGWEIKLQRPAPMRAPCEVFIDLPDPGEKPRRMDADNRGKAILDLLVDHGVIADDSSRWVRRLSIGWAPGQSGVVIRLRNAQKQTAASEALEAAAD